MSSLRLQLEIYFFGAQVAFLFPPPALIFQFKREIYSSLISKDLFSFQTKRIKSFFLVQKKIGGANFFLILNRLVEMNNFVQNQGLFPNKLRLNFECSIKEDFEIRKRSSGCGSCGQVQDLVIEGPQFRAYCKLEVITSAPLQRQSILRSCWQSRWLIESQLN